MVKGKAGAAVDTLEGGFSSLLSAMGPTVEPPVDVDLSTLPPANDQDPKADVSLLAGVISPAIQPPAVDVSMPLLANRKNSNEDLSLISLASPIIPANLSTPINIRVDEGTLPSDALTANSADLSPVNPATGRVVQIEKHAGLQNVVSTKPIDGDALIVPTDITSAAEELVQSDAAQGIDPMGKKLVQARRAQGEDIPADATKAGLESEEVKATDALDLGGKDAMRAKLLSTGDFSARLLEPVERPRGKFFGAIGASGAEAGWAQYAHHTRTTLDIPSNLNLGMSTAVPTQVADKVSYWVTQGVQNAELKLDGLGSDPVEVSISLKGGEAHVGFRSDQPDVRQMLEGALSQLKDSLAREGVVLSGATVGGSGSGSGADGGGRQQDQRRGSAASRGGGVAQTSSDTHVHRASTAVGRSLDIFV